MFRGVTIGQLRMVTALVATLFAGMVLARYIDHRGTTTPTAAPGVTLAGPVSHHSAGQLVYTNPQPQETAHSVPVTAVAAAVTATPEPPATTATPVAMLPGMLPGGLIDLNAASSEALEILPGVGPVRAAAIIAERERRGGAFSRVEDLLDVSGVGSKTLERLAPHLAVVGGGGARQHSAGAGSDAAAPVVAINRANAEQLETLKGVGPVLAREIIAHRQRHGPIRSARDLMAVKGVGPKLIQNNAGRIRYD